MNTSPFFSIVVVNYNHGAFLADSLRSITNQNFHDYELIVIDGGSTDNSVELIRNYNNKIAYWVSEPDSGQSEAFNKGFNKARGQYFLWINADDILLPRSLARAHEIITKSKAIWLTANTIFFSADKKINKCSVGPKWNTYLVKNGQIYVYGPTSIFHREIFFHVKGFDESLKYTMDGDLWMKFVNKGYAFIRAPYFFWGFRIHDESKTSHAFKNKPVERFLLERKITHQKNNHKELKHVNYFQTAYKIITGCYLKSFLYTSLYKGKDINIIK